MNSYLMSSARFEVNFLEGIFLIEFQPFEVSHGILTVGAHTAENNRLLLTGNGSVDSSRFVGNSVNCGEIDLFAAALKQISRVSVLSNDTKSRRITVESVYGTKGESRIAESEEVSQRIALMLYRRMNRHTAGLVEYHKVFVLKHNRNAETAVRLESCFVRIPEHDHVSGENRVDTADELTVTGYPHIQPFELCQQAA